MAVFTPLSRADRDAVRLRFFREFRGEHGCASATVRRDKASGEMYLSVGVSDDGVRVPAEYEGLRVRTYRAHTAVHAVQYRAA